MTTKQFKTFTTPLQYSAFTCSHFPTHTHTNCVYSTVLTLLGHANIEALLQSTGLTPVPRHLVYDADFVSVTRVRHVLLDAPPKETLTQRKMMQ